MSVKNSRTLKGKLSWGKADFCYYQSPDKWFTTTFLNHPTDTQFNFYEIPTRPPLLCVDCLQHIYIPKWSPLVTLTNSFDQMALWKEAMSVQSCQIKWLAWRLDSYRAANNYIMQQQCWQGHTKYLSDIFDCVLLVRSSNKNLWSYVKSKRWDYVSIPSLEATTLTGARE